MRHILTILLVVAVASTATAQNLIQKGNFWNKRGYFQMKIGFVGANGATLDGVDRSGQAGFTFGAALEFRVGKNWHLGIGGDVHRMHVADSGQYFLDISASLKRFMFSQRSKIAFRPGIAFGYGTMDYFEKINRVAGSDDIAIERIDRSHYMTWKALLEMVFYDENRVAPYLEIGLMGTAFGGNALHDISFGPFPYVRGGLMF